MFLCDTVDLGKSIVAKKIRENANSKGITIQLPFSLVYFIPKGYWTHCNIFI